MSIEKVDLALLRCFSVLMQERNVSRAAEKLGMTQPAVSHALARLRALFDDKLLLRSNRGMTPTARALDLAGRVRLLLHDAEQLVAPAGPFDPRTSQATFVVTATEYGELVLVPRLAEVLKRHAPGIDLLVRRPDRDLLPAWLERGEVDVRIGWVRDPHPLLRLRPLFTDRFVCLARRGHPQVRGTLTPEAYLRLPHIRVKLPETVISVHEVDEAVRELGGRLRIQILVNNHLALPQTVALTDAIATVPARFARAYAAPLKLQVLDVPLKLPVLRYAMFWHERSQSDARHRWFRRMVMEAARGLPE